MNPLCEKTKNEINEILQSLYRNNGLDFTGCSLQMINRRIKKRIFSTKTGNFNSYFNYLQNNPGEFEMLVDALTINVSKFFRNPICFEYFSKIIIPPIVSQKLENNHSNIRVWSAGCSKGEEPYSVAINICEYLKREKLQINVNIFATDIDKNALALARNGEYNFDSIKEVKVGVLRKYFTEFNEKYSINPDIKNMVDFSFFNLLNKNNYAPPNSIFGEFDVVLCRNTLIYFNTDSREKIFDKLFKSLKLNGYLILGDAETISKKYETKFLRIGKFCKIYKKIRKSN